MHVITVMTLGQANHIVALAHVEDADLGFARGAGGADGARACAGQEEDKHGIAPAGDEYHVVLKVKSTGPCTDNPTCAH